MSEAEQGDEVLTLSEAAAVLKCSPSWLKRSDVPRVAFGRKLRYLRSQLLAYAQAHLTHRVAS